ncbi:MAG: hypothetical protein JWP38_2277 [Herbaspirillum sp.]|nr:hypothetical protein [Herbaspirillum sp.]
MKKNSKTPVDINKRNAEFWKEKSRLFEERVTKRPHDLSHVVKQTTKRIEDGAIKKVESLEFQMAELDALRNIDQSAKAKMKRQRAKGHREIVIQAMRTEHQDYQTLDDFLDSKEDGSIQITKPGAKDGGKYQISCDELESDAKFSKSTIYEWWNIAKKTVLS